MENSRFYFSTKLMNNILNNCFGIPDTSYPQMDIYVGLGIEFDPATFTFTKEPVGKWFTILKDPIKFNPPMNGIIRNAAALVWPKATTDWTLGNEKISYVGLYYKRTSNTITLDDTNKDEYELICVLPLDPQETVLNNETLTLNENSIQLRLSNR